MQSGRFILLLVLPIWLPAMAEGGCPPGQLPAAVNGGIESCGPVPSGYYEQQTPRPRRLGKWVRTWGAFSLDQSGMGVMGVALSLIHI